MKTAVSTTHILAAGVIAGAFTIGFMSGPAFAQSKGDFKFDFAFEKSELETSDSAAKLLTRLESKVKRYCANLTTGSRLRQKDDTCFKSTMDTTVAGLGSSMVAELYKSRAAG
jgi:UrcA family protein